MDKLLDIIAKWDHFGQGLFLFLIVCLVIGGIVKLCKLGVVLFRGWPPIGTDDEE